MGSNFIKVYRDGDSVESGDQSTWKEKGVVRRINEFLSWTTLHGFKYLRTTGIAHKLFWMSAQIASAVWASVLCVVLWRRFIENQSILVIHPAGSTMLFPITTICLRQPIDKDRAKQFVESLKLPDGLTMDEVSALVPEILTPLDAPLTKYNMLDLFKLDDLLKYNNMTYREAWFKLAPNCSEILIRCRVKNKEEKCQNLFIATMRPDGVCCEYNPRKSFGDGFVRYGEHDEFFERNILTVVADCSLGDKKNSGYCQLQMQDQQKKGRQSEMIQLTSGNLYSADMVITTTETPVNSELSTIVCEDSLTYSVQRCMSNCAFEHIVDRCRCAPPFRSETIGDARKCLLTDLPCIQDNYDAEPKSCICPRNCLEKTINVYIDYANLVLRRNFDAFFLDLDPTRVFVLQSTLSVLESVSYLRLATNNWITLLSSLGGVFNMFLGVGIFSLLELVYFIVVRIPFKASRPQTTAS